MTAKNGRARLRDLGITIGKYPVGRYNAITDVPGVLVGHKTCISDNPYTIRTGVTAIRARDGDIHKDYPFAGYFSFNGLGEMTGISVIEEWGCLTSPIVLTNTDQVGMARDALSRQGTKLQSAGFAYKLGVAAETYDGVLNDIDQFMLTDDDVFEALDSASGGPVAEGNVGGGTGMICYEFKGGIGTSSRVLTFGEQQYTLGVLVQANQGSRDQLRVDGVPVGLELDDKKIPVPAESAKSLSSIIVIIATDAPLLPGQCKRLARRATIGLARTGGVGCDTSGDIFLCFSTGNHYDPHEPRPVIDLKMLHQDQMDPMIEATTEAVEEAILNSLTAAETMKGFKDRIAYELPLDELQEIMRKYRP